MEPQEIIKRFTEKATIITHGDISQFDAMCPVCSQESLIFSFTIIRPPRYGLFLECKECKYRQHFNLASKPPNFNQNLVLPEYQELEDKNSKLAELI